jgi:hypothetical protein
MDERMSMGVPALRLVAPSAIAPATWSWFCGHCAAPAPEGEAPAPNARVCRECELGLLLETRDDHAPGPGDAFLVVDSALLVQAVSSHAEQLLGVSEPVAVNRPVSELLVPADAEAGDRSGFAATIVAAIAGETEPAHRFVRPRNMFGVRVRAKIAPCGPPRAALVVLGSEPDGGLRAV